MEDFSTSMSSIIPDIVVVSKLYSMDAVTDGAPCMLVAARPMGQTGSGTVGFPESHDPLSR